MAMAALFQLHVPSTSPRPSGTKVLQVHILCWMVEASPITSAARSLQGQSHYLEDVQYSGWIPSMKSDRMWSTQPKVDTRGWFSLPRISRAEGPHIAINPNAQMYGHGPPFLRDAPNPDDLREEKEDEYHEEEAPAAIGAHPPVASGPHNRILSRQSSWPISTRLSYPPSAAGPNRRLGILHSRGSGGNRQTSPNSFHASHHLHQSDFQHLLPPSQCHILVWAQMAITLKVRKDMHLMWNNPKGLSVNWGSRGSKLKGDAPKALAIGCRDVLTSWGGGKPRELNWSSLAGTCALIYYFICMYMFVLDLLMTVLEYFRTLVAWGRSVHQARPWNGNEVMHEATARWWQNGREGRKNIAMHCMEMNAMGGACGIMWKEKGNIGTAWLS